jgi:hypothetical protein
MSMQAWKEVGIAPTHLPTGTRRRWVVSTTLTALLMVRPSTHCTEGWVGLRGSLDATENFSPLLEFDAQTVQPVESLYQLCYTSYQFYKK